MDGSTMRRIEITGGRTSTRRLELLHELQITDLSEKIDHLTIVYRHNDHVVRGHGAP